MPYNPAQVPPDLGGGQPGSQTQATYTPPPARTGKGAAMGTLEAAQQSYLNNPLIQNLQALLQQLSQGNNYLTYKPEDVTRLQQQSAGTVHAASNAFLGQGLSRLGGSGSGVRGGAAQGLLAESASRFAPALAASNTAIETRAMEQRNADIQNLMALITNQTNQQYAFPRDIANAQLGLAANQTQQNIASANQTGAGLAGAGAAAGAVGAAALSSKGSGAAAAAPAAAGAAGGKCWVAEAIFGVDAPETHAARYYVNNGAPAWFSGLYGMIGRQVAWLVRRSRLLRWALRPAFLWMSRRGQELNRG